LSWSTTVHGNQVQCLFTENEWLISSSLLSLFYGFFQHVPWWSYWWTLYFEKGKFTVTVSWQQMFALDWGFVKQLDLVNTIFWSRVSKISRDGRKITRSFIICFKADNMHVEDAISTPCNGIQYWCWYLHFHLLSAAAECVSGKSDIGTYRVKSPCTPCIREPLLIYQKNGKHLLHLALDKRRECLWRA